MHDCSEHSPKGKKTYKGTLHQLLAHHRHCLLGGGSSAVSERSTGREGLRRERPLPSPLPTTFKFSLPHQVGMTDLNIFAC